ncbi:MAG TPA: hypothetical protein VMY40_04385 [Anaerolineae bacterium]|nr:hypothetical protein [Phycisphaerae bacterium]HUX75861.1 hypothetical protein [Anaerolineae bacterium]
METQDTVVDTAGIPTWTYRITMEDVMRRYPPQPPLTDFEPKYKGEVLAVGRAVYETVNHESADFLVRLGAGLAYKYAPGNLWIHRTYGRLPYPHAVYWPLGCAFATEKAAGRRFDWYVWFDDDVLVEPRHIEMLLEAADPLNRPFVTALPIDRWEPHLPAITEIVDGKVKRWVLPPKTGTVPVAHTGLCLAVFHRTLFERVPEPWFGIAPPTLNSNGMNPDYWWSVQLMKAGIQPYVRCDCNPIHLGRNLHIDADYSRQWLERSPRRNEYPETDPANRETSPTTGATVIDPPPRRNGRET